MKYLTNPTKKTLKYCINTFHKNLSQTKNTYIIEVCDLPAIANGRLSGTKKTVFKSGESVTVSCDAGYDATNSPSTCHEDRTWKPVPDCVDVTCREIPDHMKQEEAILDFPELTVGEVANVTYNSTIYHLDGGSVELRCTATRELAWTASPVFGRALCKYAALEAVQFLFPLNIGWNVNV